MGDITGEEWLSIQEVSWAQCLEGSMLTYILSACSAVGDSWLSFSGLCLYSCGTATSCPRLLTCEEEAIAAPALAALVEE